MVSVISLGLDGAGHSRKSEMGLAEKDDIKAT